MTKEPTIRKVLDEYEGYLMVNDKDKKKAIDQAEKEILKIVNKEYIRGITDMKVIAEKNIKELSNKLHNLLTDRMGS